MTESNAENLVSIPVIDLLRVTPFKGDDDMRYYLNGVLVTPHQDHALLVATNGHWMAVYESEAARTDKPRILDLPKWFVNQIEIVRRGERLDGQDVDLDDDSDGFPPPSATKTLIVATEKSRLTILEGAEERLVKPGLPFIDGKFPNWQSVIPEASTLERGLFSAFAPNYLSELHRAVPDQREHPLFCYQDRKGGPGVFRFGNMPGLLAVLMPRRDIDKEVKDWPTWMKKESQETAP